MNDDELIEAMLVAMYDDGCPGAVDSMRAVLAIVREHDNRLSLARELGQAEAALKAMRAELQSLREHDGRDDAARAGGETRQHKPTCARFNAEVTGNAQR